MGKGRILVIAGSDSSGGAGLEADQKVIAAHGCYAMTATTALTAQNTLGVVDIHHTPPDFVGKLIDVCISDIGVDVVKTGMLASAETIEVVAKCLQKHDVKILVIDPVMVSTSGSQLLPLKAVRDLRTLLLPHATILTPNVPEAKLLLFDAGQPAEDPKNVADLIEIAKSVQSLGPKYVLVKGGHLPFKKDGTVATTDEERELMIDILYGEGEVTRIETAYQNCKNTHGTGCSMASAAIASNLGNGQEMTQAVKGACRYVEAGIKTATDLGHGNGPINHFHSTYTLPFAPGRFVEYLLDRSDVKKAWREHTHHDFVASLANGSLPVDSFKYYLIQDYLYLVQFARANALAGYKAKTMEDIAAAAKIVSHIHHEMSLHIEYCEGFGVTKKDIEATEESQACTAYTRYVLDIGQAEDWLALQVSMAPCLIGYGEIAKRLHADPKTKREGNIYWKWIENYVADDYSEAVQIGSEALLERHIVLQSPSRIEELAKIFIHATRMETGFWDMGGSQK
ncbi:putative hydroxymethylpyrimidine/phosphomethylpyrimidine kinase [Lachnellula subtilissima]|uniref:Putative hydroxymethylpyrimidine/phosphomethylpyrimidine kinase n=1 Tax=Lachnellula subtilissima TaxID=602034 RepID=A0A8H8U8H3_9HELO|nr:putative hydroxymethylpyrimidine/phosphomethylpyrimidine kinase [Lachnellula subtilissima]